MNSHRKRKHNCNIPQYKVQPRLQVNEPIPPINYEIQQVAATREESMQQAMMLPAAAAAVQVAQHINPTLPEGQRRQAMRNDAKYA